MVRLQLDANAREISIDKSLRQCLKFSVSLRGSPRRYSNPAVPKLYQNPM